MKKLTKLIAGLSVLTVLMVCMTAVSFAGTVDDKVTVTFRAGMPGSFDYINEKLEVTGNLAEDYFPAIAENEPIGVSFADALVAAHIEKYGADKVTENMSIANSSYGTQMVKQFGHDIVGLYYANKIALTGSVSDPVDDGDVLYAFAYTDASYSDLVSQFDSDVIEVPAGVETDVKLSCSNFGAEAIPQTATLKAVNPETLEMTDVEGATYKDGQFTFKFADKGVYYISADGTVTYPGWSGDEVTGKFAGAWAKVVVAPTDEVTIDFKAGLAGSFDYINEKLKVSGNLFETYFPALAADDAAEGVSIADVLVAAHLKKYGEAKLAENLAVGAKDWVSMQFGHTLVGFYYVNNVSSASGVNTDTVKDGDVLFAGSYSDDSWSDLYSYFDKKTVNTTTGKNVTLNISCDNWGTTLVPTTVKAMKVNKSTGKMTEISGSKYADGKLTFKFSKAGTYYVSAEGTITYEGFYGETTGKFAGAYAKVVVKDVKPAKPVIKSAKRTSKTKAAVVWGKAKNAKKYQVAYRKKGTTKWSTKTTAKTKITLKVKKGKAYQVKVRAINGTAKSSYSKVKTIKKK